MTSGRWSLPLATILVTGILLVLSMAGIRALQPQRAAGTGAVSASASSSAIAESLTVYCAAGLKPALEAAAAHYAREGGEQIALRYGGSGELLSAIAISPQGDLFIAADSSYADDAARKGLARERFELASQQPVLAVAAGNPKHIAGIADLLRADVRFGLANPETASIGRLTKRLLVASGQWLDLQPHILVMKPTVSDIATDLRIGAIDCAILWDATLMQMPGLERVPTTAFDAAHETVTACVLGASQHPTDALRFARFLAACDRGNGDFAAHGFTPVPGDAWSIRPALTVFSGAVNRVAIERLVTQFGVREGADITTVVNGCGILCATMKSLAATPGAHVPDAYYACDICFVPPVAQLYPEAVLLTQTPIVIAVPLGNPQQVHSLLDLARPGLRVGLCNAEQSSLGFISKRLLTRSNIWEGVERNASSQVPTADMLINQLLVGSLDAAIVYSTNVQLRRDKLQAIAIDSPAAKAVQPFVIAKDSPNHQLAGRLLAYLQASRPVFAEIGFQWRDDQRPVVSASLPPIGGDLDATPATLASAPAARSAHGH